MEDMWNVLKTKRTDFYEYHKAFRQAHPDKSTQIDDIFLAHGFFEDKNKGNKKWDVGEPIRDSNKDGKHDP
ncbi:MAG: hypothetical protein KKD39_00855 [Candidatus Altiarchaeota archaeon]|nr:hypothetical protein [Candidatus Altiarchaeota archaeon]